jgi:hypothetical protein
VEGPPVTQALLATLTALPGISAAANVAGGIRIDTDDFGAPLAGALEVLSGAQIRVTGIQTGQVRLEDVFIALTGRALRDDPPQPSLP